MKLIRKMFKLLVISALFLGATAALAAKQPDWVNGSSAEYPDELYLVGRGVGSTEAEAQDRARGDLATIFEVRVQVSNEISTTVAKSGTKEQVNKLASQQVSAKTDKVISGITIAKIWRDPAMDFHALAVLSRSQASASLQEELSKIDDELRQQTQAADSENDPLLKVAALSQAQQTLIKRDGFQASLKVVDPSGRGVPSSVSQAALQQQISDILRKVRIAAGHSENEGATEFAKMAKAGLAAAGFMATKPEDADLVLSGTLDMVDVGRSEGWYWSRATLAITLTEKESGRVRGHKIWPVKASAQDQLTARSRAMIEIDKIFKQELRSTIIDFAANPESAN